MNDSLLKDAVVSAPQRPSSVARPSQSTAPSWPKTPRVRPGMSPSMKGSLLFLGGVVVVSGGILFLMTQMHGKSFSKRRAPIDIRAIR